MRSKTLNIVRRNFQISMNMKASSIILILGPLILITLIGIALQDTSVKNIEAGVFVHNWDEDGFTQTILDKLNENSIKTTLFTNLNNCKKEVEDDNSQLCLEILDPTLNEINQKNQDVVLHVDFSKQRTVWSIIGRVQEIIGEESAKERETLIQEIKDTSGEALKEADIQEQKLNNAISEIEFIENNYLDEIEDKSNKISSSIKLIEEKLNDAEKTIDDAVDFLDDNDLPSLGLISALSDVQNAKKSINEIKTNIPNVEATKIRNKLTSIKSELTNARDSIQDSKEKIRDVNQMDFYRVMNPIQVTYESVLSGQSGKAGEDLKFLDFLFPSFLIFFILFDSIIFSATLRMRDRKSNAHLRNMISKVRGKTFILGDFLTSLIMVTIQILIITLIASTFLNLDIISNIPSLIGIIIVAVSIFSLFGIMIGSIFSSQETVIISSISLSLLLFVFSSIVTPLETLPKGIATFIGLTPLALLESKIRISLIFGSQLAFAAKEFISLLIMAGVSLFVTRIFYIKNKRKEI